MVSKNPIVFIIGVSGVGKTTIAQSLSDKIKITCIDADDFHPESNISKMEKGTPLNDEDRQQWLENINKTIKEKYCNKGVVIACSALKEIYRKKLAIGIEDIKWISLYGSYDLIYNRMQSRNHFMPSTLLQSQFDTWELPAYGIKVDVINTPEEITQQAYNYIKQF